MDDDRVQRAIAAVTALAESLGLTVSDVAEISNSNKLGLRVEPSGVFARVASVGDEVAALEIEMAQQLARFDAPVARLATPMGTRVHERDGFAVTWWEFYEPDVDAQLSPAAYAGALADLHGAMRRIKLDTPHCLDRVAEAHDLVASREATPGLADRHRNLVIDALRSFRRLVDQHAAPHQILHGEPHPGNILNTRSGARFIDLETCCRGPIEFDVGHVPADVALHSSGLDDDLLQESRRVILAMIAAWRWNATDEFPDGLRHGRNVLELLETGPPWPTIDDLDNM